MVTSGPEDFTQIEQLLRQLGMSTAANALVRLASGGLVYGLRGVAKTLERVVGRRIDAKFDSVEHFWAVGVDQDQVGSDAKVLIRGLLLPYGPLVPAHPMQRPGYTLEGWDIMGDLGVSDTEAYDARDGIIYGDRVVRLSRPARKLYYAGLYGHYYGISNVAIPVLIEDKLLGREDLLNLWQEKNCQGVVADLIGVVKQMRSFYRAYYSRLRERGTHIPKELLEYPNYALEAKSLKVLPSTQQYGVTHIAASVCWEQLRSRAPERARTEYFNCRSSSQWNKCESDLHPIRVEKRDSLILDYDDLAYLSPHKLRDLPQYNELLSNWVD